MKDAFQWMVPFLHRCEGQREGAAKSLLKEYLVGLARQDLTLPLLVFQHSKPDVSMHTRRRGRARAPRQGRFAASLSRRCCIYDLAWTGAKDMSPRQLGNSTLRTYAQKGEEKRSTAAPNVGDALVDAQTSVSPCVAVPAEGHRGPGPADGGRPGVHLQLRERQPAQPLL